MFFKPPQNSSVFLISLVMDYITLSNFSALLFHLISVIFILYLPYLVSIPVSLHTKNRIFCLTSILHQMVHLSTFAMLSHTPYMS